MRLTFDPAVVGYREILEIFFAIHDPTTPDRQGNDVGTQYRSAIYTTTAGQAQQAQASRDAYAQRLHAAGYRID